MSVFTKDLQDSPRCHPPCWYSLMNFLLWIAAAVAGLLNPIQSGQNATLGKTLGNPYAAVLISLAVSLVSMVAVDAYMRGAALLNVERFSQVPWWAWGGGFCGAFLLLSQPLVAPKLGAGVYIGVSVTAAIAGSIVCDNYALLGFPQHSANIGRLIGAALMIAGVTLVAVF